MKKPRRIHVQLASLVGILRGSLEAVREEGFKLGRSEDYCRGAEDGVNEFLMRARQVWGNDFTRAWEASRRPFGHS